MKSFMVTGASGFLGAALMERLLQDGYNVIGVDKKGQNLFPEDAIEKKRFTFHKMDMGKSSFNAVLKHIAAIDGIFHLASQQPSSTKLGYDNFYRGNVETTLNLINFARARKVKFIAYTSTTSVFNGISGGVYIDEESKPAPTDYYSITKYIAEKLLQAEFADKPTKIIIIRYPSIFGKNHLGGIVHTYYQSISKGDDISVYGRGQRYRNLIYVRDAVSVLSGIIAKFNKLKKNEIFTAGSRDSVKMAELARLIKAFSNSRSRIVFLDGKPPAGSDVFIDISKIRRVLGVKPMAIAEGLKSYLRDMSHEE